MTAHLDPRTATMVPDPTTNPVSRPDAKALIESIEGWAVDKAAAWRALRAATEHGTLSDVAEAQKQHNEATRELHEARGELLGVLSGWQDMSETALREVVIVLDSFTDQDDEGQNPALKAQYEAAAALGRIWGVDADAVIDRLKPEMRKRVEQRARVLAREFAHACERNKALNAVRVGLETMARSSEFADATKCHVGVMKLRDEARRLLALVEQALAGSGR